jgi:protease I
MAKMDDHRKNSILIFIPRKDFNEEEFDTVKNRFIKAGKRIFITSDDHFICCGSKGMKVKSDICFYNIKVNNFSALVLIGGPGSKAYRENENLNKTVKKFFDAGKVVAAICSSPLILAAAGVLQNKKATCYSEDKLMLINAGIEYQNKNVVVDGNIVTADNSRSVLQFTEAVLHLIK